MLHWFPVCGRIVTSYAGTETVWNSVTATQ